MPLPRIKQTYSLLYHFVVLFICLSFLLRTLFLFLSFSKVEPGLTALLRIFGEGLLFDLAVAAFFVAPYALYLLIFPVKWSNSLLNKILTYLGFFLTTLILMFSFFAEFTFWQEFESRFNFIAVDYLIYTYEVVNNINESYPLPLLIGGMLLLTATVFWFFHRRHYFQQSFQGKAPFLQRLALTVVLFAVVTVFAFRLRNSFAEQSANRYQNELAKSGIYSFFAAFRNNELNYEQFYKLIDNRQAFELVRTGLTDSTVQFYEGDLSIRRKIHASGPAYYPNVIMITVESFSADFMARFGNKEGLTPVLDSLAGTATLFTNLYATGTRTVRGMEALTLAVPPTPGNGIVRRENNNQLYSVGSIFRSKGYQTNFFYGGDGYFDNMNQYFGSNGFNITDRGRNLLVKDNFSSPRYHIPDSLVQFENAWGICDEDLYAAVIRNADQNFENGNRFYDFVMTTSNHRPYTYPEGKIKFPSGSGRSGAVRYTDYAIGQFLQKIKTKPWFANTTIIIIADHCANSAGKNAIDIDKYHIPALILNLPVQAPAQIPQTCSQIDLYPTLFRLLNWEYNSNLYGQDVLSPQFTPRVLLGTYQKLAFLRHDSLVILSPQQQVETYRYLPKTNEQVPINIGQEFIRQAIAQYQTAYYLFKNGGLKE